MKSINWRNIAIIASKYNFNMCPSCVTRRKIPDKYVYGANIGLIYSFQAQKLVQKGTIIHKIHIN